MAMANALFAKWLVPLLNLVEQACSAGLLGTVRGSGAECGLVKERRYMTDDGHLAAHRFLWSGWVSIMCFSSPWNVSPASGNCPKERRGL